MIDSALFCVLPMPSYNAMVGEVWVPLILARLVVQGS